MLHAHPTVFVGLEFNAIQLVQRFATVHAAQLLLQTTQLKFEKNPAPQAQFVELVAPEAQTQRTAVAAAFNAQLLELQLQSIQRLP